MDTPAPGTAPAVTPDAAPHVAVIGAGPAGLMAAQRLAEGGARVTVYERMPSVGRKFLMAGRGGLNLTHSEPLANFLNRYGAAAPRAARWIGAFTPADLIAWAGSLGQETFVGSSGRVFPRAMKASPLLRAWLTHLAALDVRIVTRARWTGWREGALAFDTPQGVTLARPDATLLALGGGSWARLGSDGAWAGILEAAGVGVAPLAPANMGAHVPWSDSFRARFAGCPLKGAAFAHAGRRVRGEAVVTDSGLEGGAIYALSGPLRDAMARDGAAHLTIDLKPDIDAQTLAARLARPRGKDSLSSHLRKAARLDRLAVALLREAGAPPQAPDALAARIKALPLTLTGVQGLARAISSAGGVRLDALDERLMLTALPGVFAAGEMLDWEAPTGGYLLQASFASGAAAARGALDWLSRTQAAI